MNLAQQESRALNCLLSVQLELPHEAARAESHGNPQTPALPVELPSQVDPDRLERPPPGLQPGAPPSELGVLAPRVFAPSSQTVPDHPRGVPGGGDGDCARDGASRCWHLRLCPSPGWTADAEDRAVSRSRTGYLSLTERVRYLMRQHGLNPRRIWAAGRALRPALWTYADSNREPSPCKGAALPVGATGPDARQNASCRGRCVGLRVGPCALAVFRTDYRFPSSPPPPGGSRHARPLWVATPHGTWCSPRLASQRDS